MKTWTSLIIVALARCVIGHECQVSGWSADCRGRGLTSVPSDLPSNLTSLDLSGNKIRHLQVCSFCNLTYLQELRLRGNLLDQGDRSFPKEVFSPSANLKVLDISQNFQADSFYPGKAMASLTQLESLTLDLLPQPLPEVFTSFLSLQSLSLYAFPWTRGLSNETFSSLAEVPLQRLQLSGQDLHFLHRDAFQPVSQRLQQLEVVDLPSLSLPHAIEALHVFQGRNMSLIRLEGLSGSLSAKNDSSDRHVIDERRMQIATNVCVVNFSVARNSLTFMAFQFALKGCLHKTIRYFDCHGNFVPIYRGYLLVLALFKQLEYFDISTNLGTFIGAGTNDIETESDFIVLLRLPPRLVYFNVSHPILPFGKLSSPIAFYNSSNLRTLDYSYSGLSNLNYPVMGLENLWHLDLSGNNLGYVSAFLTQNLNDLKILAVRDADLDTELFVMHGVVAFGHLRQLESLDVSGNNLRGLPTSSIANLSEVILSRNSFTSIPLEVDAMPRLVTLDLTFNSITFLTSQQREQLDARAQSSNGSFRLLLEGNPLSCDCSVLDFVSWLSSTSVRLDRGGNYSCVTDGGVFTTTAYVAANLDRKWRECVGSWWLGMSSAWLVVTLMTLVLAFLVSRFWTNVQHVVLRLLGFGHALLRRADFRYDVYVAYSDEDYRFACLDLLPLLEADGLRVYVRDRDEPVGESRAEEVVSAVGKSWRIVFLLTEAFLHDEWCQFTALTAARCSASPHGPGRVLLVLLRPLPRADLPPSLLTVVEEQDVFDLGGEHPGPALWGRLLHRVKEQ